MLVQTPWSSDRLTYKSVETGYNMQLLHMLSDPSMVWCTSVEACADILDVRHFVERFREYPEERQLIGCFRDDVLIGLLIVQYPNQTDMKCLLGNIPRGGAYTAIVLIDKRCRQNGYAKETLQSLCYKLAKSDDYCVLICGISASNNAGLRLMDSLGYEVVGVADNYSSIGIPVGESGPVFKVYPTIKET